MTDILRPEDLRYGADGLLPAVVQEYDTREVLMLAWVDAEAVRRTLDTRKATYLSLIHISEPTRPY